MYSCYKRQCICMVLKIDTCGATLVCSWVLQISKFVFRVCLALCEACKASIDSQAFNCGKLWVSLRLFVILLQTLLNCFPLAVFSWVMMQWFHASSCNCTSCCTGQSPCQIHVRDCTWGSAEPTLASHAWLQYLKCTCERVWCIWSLSTERKRVRSCYVHLPLLEISCVMRITSVLWVWPRMLM